MKNIIFSSLVSLLTAFVVNGQAPILEIHHIGAGDGDATLIMIADSTGINVFTGKQNWDTCVILIDGQRYSGAGKEIWRYVKDTVGAIFPGRNKIDYLIVSHLHIDHFGGLASFIGEVVDNGWTISSVYDRQNFNYSKYISANKIADECYDDMETDEPVGPAFDKYVQALSSAGITSTKTFNIGDNLVEGYKTAYVFCVVGYGLTSSAGSSMADTCFLPTKISNGKTYYYAKSENDYSIGFLVRFQGFNYLTSGDLGGITTGNYIDGETPMTKGIMSGFRYPTDYHICANKVSHHGSSESTSEWFAKTNDFTVSVFPACLRSYGASSNALPTETAIMNLTDTKRDTLLYTFIPNNPQTLSSYWTKGNLDAYNDVVIKFSAPPGYGDVSMTIIQRKKSKKYVYLAPATVRTIICNKGHDW